MLCHVLDEGKYTCLLALNWFGSYNALILLCNFLNPLEMSLLYTQTKVGYLVSNDGWCYKEHTLTIVSHISFLSLCVCAVSINIPHTLKLMEFH